MANFDLNKCEFAGRVTDTPELKSTPSGAYKVTFRIAVSRRFAEDDGNGNKARRTDFFTVVVWNKTAEFVAKYFKRGSSIYVCGELRNRKWTDEHGVTRHYTELAADDVRFVDSKVDTEKNMRVEAMDEAAPIQFETLSDDEELPF